MNITVQLDLPEEVAARARARGLLNPKQMAWLIAREVTAEDRGLITLSQEMCSVSGESISIEEIDRIVDEARSKHPGFARNEPV